MTHFRPPPPKPTRLNRVALLLAGALALVTFGFAFWMMSCTHPRARDAAGDADAATLASRRVVPQRPSYPISSRIDSQTSRSWQTSEAPHGALPLARPAGIPAEAEVLPRAWRSALTVPVRVARADTVALQTSSVAASPYVLLSGAMISASLVTEIHSTLPGLVLAQVDRDVYDTPSMRCLLIPRGARLVGRYDSKVAQGEDALSVVWTRVIFPDGRALPLPDLESADLAGTSGLRGAVNSHLAHAYLDAGLLSVVGAGAQLSQAPSSVPYGVATPGQVIAGSVGQQMTEQSLETLRSDARLAPVITVRRGTSFLVVVSRDVVFDRAYQRD
ncbi:MAG TPA: TrbI/VirB10 family protein [Gemmatimonadaceae bacterium]|nr:TrbI/VirB10 family protein [Gemmatimonadaceae bacterium]